MSDKKMNTVNIGNYLVAKNGVTKYIKLEAAPKADEKTKKLVADLVALLGTEVLYVNLFDAEFRAKHNIPEFARGRIAVEVKEAGAAPAASNDEVNF